MALSHPTLMATPLPFQLGRADLQRADVQALIRHHQAAALAANKICEGHALGIQDYVDQTAEGALTLYEARDDHDLLGLCGLYRLSETVGELKTMHTRGPARGRGVGQALLSHVIAVAQKRGLEQIKLETGTADFFAAATRLYARLGFEDCPPFADYEANPDSRFMQLKVKAVR